MWVDHWSESWTLLSCLSALPEQVWCPASEPLEVMFSQNKVELHINLLQNKVELHISSSADLSSNTGVSSTRIFNFAVSLQDIYVPNISAWFLCKWVLVCEPWLFYTKHNILFYTKNPGFTQRLTETQDFLTSRTIREKVSPLLN